MTTIVRRVVVLLGVAVLAAATMAPSASRGVVRGTQGVLPAPARGAAGTLLQLDQGVGSQAGNAGLSPVAAAVSRAQAAALAASKAAGANVTCIDLRSGESFSYFAQHLRADGQLDTMWAGNTDRLCLGTSDDLHQVTCPDGTGGVYAAWVDASRGDPDIDLQHFGSDGGIVSGWPASGLSVCRAAYSQYNLGIAPDGSGGVFLVWQDFRSRGAGDIYAQHLSAADVPVVGWPADGLALCTEIHAQAEPHVAADSRGGAYAVWQDRRPGHQTLYAQHFGGDGTPLLGWPVDGAQLSAAVGDACSPEVLPDSTGGLTVIWRQEDSTGVSICASRVGVADSPSASWPPARRVLASGARQAGDPAIIAAAGGSQLVAWSEWRSDACMLRVQKLASNGTVDPAWPAGGATLAAAPLGRNAPRLLAQPDSGAVVAWEDFRDGTSDIYAQHVTGSGAIATGWIPNGIAIRTGDGEQYAPSLAGDGQGGTLVTWADATTSTQAGFFGSQSVLAQQVTLSRSSALPGHAHLVWNAPRTVAPSTFEGQRRAADTGDWQVLGRLTADDSSHVVIDDRSAPEGATLEYRLTLTGDGWVKYLPAVRLAIPVTPLRLALRRAWANPKENVIMLSLALPRGAAPQLGVFDVAGRRIERLTLEGLEPGEQTVRVPVSWRTSSGVYFLRLSQGSEARTAKLVFIR